MLILLCAGVFWCGAALADCTARDRRDMKDNGMSETRIQRICNGIEQSAGERIASDRSAGERGAGDRIAGGGAATTASRSAATASARPQSASSNICQTQLNSCALNREGPAGAVCWCNTSTGPARGRLTAR